METSGRSGPVDKLSIVGKSSVGMNYEELEPLEDEIGPNAITLYVEEKHGNNEVTEGEKNDATTEDDYMETDTAAETGTTAETDTVVPTADKYVEQPSALKPSKYIEEWGDGLSLSKHDEFLSKKAVQEMVDRATLVNAIIISQQSQIVHGWW